MATISDKGSVSAGEVCFPSCPSGLCHLDYVSPPTRSVTHRASSRRRRPCVLVRAAGTTGTSGWLTTGLIAPSWRTGYDRLPHGPITEAQTGELGGVFDYYARRCNAQPRTERSAAPEPAVDKKKQNKKRRSGRAREGERPTQARPGRSSQTGSHTMTRDVCYLDTEIKCTIYV